MDANHIKVDVAKSAMTCWVSGDSDGLPSTAIARVTAVAGSSVVS